MKRDTPTRKRPSPVHSQGTEEGGAPSEQHHAIYVHALQEKEREGRTPPE